MGGSVAGQCPSLSPAGGDFGYQERGNRCEGLLTEPATGGSIRVVSFTTAQPSFSLDRGTVIRIRVPDTSAFGARGVNVRSRSKDDLLYYRMDATLPSGGILEWPVDPVLRPNGLGPDQIGVFGWYEASPGDTVFVPVRVSEGSQQVELLVYADFNVERWNWRATGGAGPGPVESRGLVSRGQPLRMRIGSGLAGLVSIQVNAWSMTGGEPEVSQTIRVLLPSDP